MPVRTSTLFLFLPYLFALAILLTGCSNKTEFDTICEIFQKAENNSELSKLPYQEKLDKINEEVWNTVKKAETIEVLSAVATVNPEDKYTVFIQSVEYITKKPWRCPAMENLSQNTEQTLTSKNK